MKRILIYILLFSFYYSGIHAQNEPHSNRVANYTMDVKLDTENRKLIAETAVLFRNPSADTIRDLQFHIYYNAFQNNQSTFFKESDGVRNMVSDIQIPKNDWSYTTISNIEDQFGNNLTNNQTYIQPDDDNLADRTVLRVQLAEPILPFDTLRFNMNWEAQIPTLTIRTGSNMDYYFMAQWFPKLGVYEPAGTRFATKGQWNCHQYHRNTEYYANFGNYKVTLDVPEEYIVGASGERIAESKKDGRKIVTQYVEDVIDFTWTAYPHFLEKTDQWGDVAIRLLHHEDRECLVSRYMKATKISLEYLNEHLGVYPYKTLTIVDPPYHGIKSSAMEYPTLITGAGFYCFPEGVRTNEAITAHEFVHQYFMQMLATNEQEEAWMDEGFTAYYEARIIDHYYGNILESNWFDFKASNINWRRMRYFALDNPMIDEIGQFGWHFKHGGYHSLVYSKAALMLKTIEGIVGIETMDVIMKNYFEKWKFKHPGRQDFIDIVKETLNSFGDKYSFFDIDTFFEQVLMGTGMCDYAVGNIYNDMVENKIGVFEKDGKMEKLIPEEFNNDQFYSRAILHRLGEITLPVDVVVNFDNGKSVTERWDGLERSFEFNYSGTNKIVSVHIDPDRKILLDKNLINNSYTIKEENAGVWKYFSSWMVWMQQLLQSMSIFV